MFVCFGGGQGVRARRDHHCGDVPLAVWRCWVSRSSSFAAFLPPSFSLHTLTNPSLSPSLPPFLPPFLPPSLLQRRVPASQPHQHAHFDRFVAGDRHRAHVLGAGQAAGTEGGREGGTVVFGHRAATDFSLTSSSLPPSPPQVFLLLLAFATVPILLCAKPCIINSQVCLPCLPPSLPPSLAKTSEHETNPSSPPPSLPPSPPFRTRRSKPA